MSIESGDPITVGAMVGDDVASFFAMLDPTESSSGNAGRHRVVIENTGSMTADLTLAAQSASEVDLELATSLVTVEPGRTVRVELLAAPRSRFWRGAPRRHPFTVEVMHPQLPTHTLIGTYEQRQRLQPWVQPAVLGALGGLLLSMLVWALIGVPITRSIADDAAADALEADRAALEQLIAELEAAAAEAAELPLGQPTDLRLAANAAVGESVIESFTVTSGRVLSITDLVFQNPSGAAGTVALRRDGEVLLESNLANFRDLDFHFVAPFRFGAGSTIELQVVCQSAGASADGCDVSATLTGFVDETG